MKTKQKKIPNEKLATHISIAIIIYSSVNTQTLNILFSKRMTYRANKNQKSWQIY